MTHLEAKMSKIDCKSNYGAEVRKWLEGVVIGLNLCPFASKPFLENRIRIVVNEGRLEEDVYTSLFEELSLLDEVDVSELETTLLVFPNMFASFVDYNDFLYLINEFLKLQNWEGVYQVASFHPKYQFADTDMDDVENFTNRAPYPVFHLIREDSLSKALDFHPDPEGIPHRNIELMQAMDESDLHRFFSWCFEK